MAVVDRLVAVAGGGTLETVKAAEEVRMRIEFVGVRD